MFSSEQDEILAKFTLTLTSNYNSACARGENCTERALMEIDWQALGMPPPGKRWAGLIDDITSFDLGT